ncbi:hypothetical protein [Dactylosporangium sp. CA-092794]|uniref:hypothetical protein n=1 Tax=Dactylosporangium sp. CA-092794 TaxID=3239929 RepID=UPI003D906E51
MRVRVVLCASAVICLSAGVSAPAAAHAPSPAAGTSVCAPNPKDVNEISGLVATQSGYYAVQDSQLAPAKPKIYVLDNACKLTKTIAYPFPARDPEDLALDKNGTLYIADIGDNDEASGGQKEARSSVAIWTMAANAGQPTINRLTYPDGKKHDAEALLINGDGLPVIITKTPPIEVYVPEGPLVPGVEKPSSAQMVKLKKVGTFTTQDTKTANPFGLVGEKVVTGAAASPDGSKVVVRTYSDAYEFDVPGGDVVKAITSGKPRITPLPNEPQGESITYTPDGKNYVTASDQDTTKKTPLLKYTPTDFQVAAAGTGTGGSSPTSKPKDKSFLQSVTLQDITYAVSAIGLLGLGLVIAGVIGIRRSRAARRLAGPATPSRTPADDPEHEFGMPATVGGPPGAPGGNVYGGSARPAANSAPGNVYGGAAPAGAPGSPGAAGGNVYGAASPGNARSSGRAPTAPGPGGPGGPGGGNVYGGSSGNAPPGGRSPGSGGGPGGGGPGPGGGGPGGGAGGGGAGGAGGGNVYGGGSSGNAPSGGRGAGGPGGGGQPGSGPGGGNVYGAGPGGGGGGSGSGRGSASVGGGGRGSGSGSGGGRGSGGSGSGGGRGPSGGGSGGGRGGGGSGGGGSGGDGGDGGPGGGGPTGGNVYGGGGSPGAGDRGGYGPQSDYDRQSPRGFAQGPPPSNHDQRGGYAPHR